jgi:Subtilase family
VPNDPSFANQWGLSKINCPAAWNRTTGAGNVVVAVIDTGVDLDHPELAPLLVPGTDMVDLGANPTAPAGFRFEGDFQGRDNVPQDEVGHGTHVAGTIACLSNNGLGVAGVTWACRIMPVRVLARIVNINNSADVRGTGSAADIASGIRWAVDNGARVLNLSLGGTTDTQVERDAIAYAIAHGAVVVAAMGNAFQQGNPTSFPAAYPNVVAVGAIDSGDHRANFSQTGAHIDIAAPGVGILSTVWNDGFTTMSGTSMASPHVAGVAALILSCNGNLSGPQVADILRQTARPLRDVATDPVPNISYGFGCVDAAAALMRACPPQPSQPIVACPSVVTICPTIVNCPTRTIACRPSVVTICPTTLISCASRTVACRPSVITACVTQSFNCPTRTVQCAVTQPVQCRPSLAVPCPSGPVCGQPPIGDPAPFGMGAQGMGYDPYGWDDAGFGAFDPYSSQFQGPWDDGSGGGQGGGGCCGG